MKTIRDRTNEISIPDGEVILPSGLGKDIKNAVERRTSGMDVLRDSVNVPAIDQEEARQTSRSELAGGEDCYILKPNVRRVPDDRELYAWSGGVSA